MIPDGVDLIRDLPGGVALAACRHTGVTAGGLPRNRAEAEAAVGTAAASSGARCPTCHAEPWMTDGHRLPVTMLVEAPRELTLL